MTDFALGTTFDIKFTTRRFSTGVPFALDSGVISAYPDNSTTQITAGITLTADFDGVTGLNNVRVVATGGNGYAAGSSYALVITTGTVDSVSVVGEVVGHFTLERGAAFGRLGAPAGASVSADVAAVKSDTAAILTDTAEIGVAGAGLTNINLPDQTMDITGNITGNLSGSVGSVTAAVTVGTINAGVITAAAIATDAIDSDALAADAVAEIADAVWDEILAGHLATGSTGEALSDAGGAGTPPTAAAIADAVWDEAQADHVAAGSFGETATEIAAILVDTGTTLQAELDGIQADTEDIQTRLPAALVGGRIDASVGAVAANAITAAAIATDAIDADALATDAVNEIADGLLNRDFAAVSDTNPRTALNALRFLRNKWSVVAGTLTVTEEDDTTTAWTAATTGTAGADPITTVDPA